MLITKGRSYHLGSNGTTAWMEKLLVVEYRNTGIYSCLLHFPFPGDQVQAGIYTSEQPSILIAPFERLHRTN